MNYSDLYQTLLSIKGSIQTVAAIAGTSRNTVRNTLALGMNGPCAEKVKTAAIDYMQGYSKRTEKELARLAEQMEANRNRARQLANL